MLVVGPSPDRAAMLVDLDQTRDKSSNYRRVATRVRSILGRSHVEDFVATHYHMDHVGRASDGILKLLDDHDERFTVGRFIAPGDASAGFMPSRRGIKHRVDIAMPGWLSSGTVGDFLEPRFEEGWNDLGEGVRVEVLAAGGIAADDDRGDHPRRDNSPESGTSHISSLAFVWERNEDAGGRMKCP